MWKLSYIVSGGKIIKQSHLCKVNFLKLDVVLNVSYFIDAICIMYVYIK